ncbi:MAG: glycosyltransferase family 4 protein, partial [Leptolyngbyaceae bacterium]|nr:glycosyltransferase family 4 protein [Leptolyngbyaceae bacterium]
LQLIAQNQARTDPITLPANSVLANMWDYARQVAADYDLILNFAYDWLPFYLTPFFKCPIAHLVSMGSLSDGMDRIIEQVVVQFPGTVGVHTQAQAATFSCAEQLRCLSNGIDLSLYDFCSTPGSSLGWIGRISPEKGVEDAIAASQATGIPLKMMGTVQDPAYWQTIRQAYPAAPITYLGFLPSDDLQREVGQCRALLVTPRWIEAFGNVAIEALACGVPVIAYRRGGPSEIVRDGKTGWLVEPDSVSGLVAAIAHIDQIDRSTCRQQAEQEFSLEAMGDRMEQWFWDILGACQNNA